MALYGIYGRHEIRDCPLNNSETRKMVAEMAKKDMSSVLPKYKINKIVGRYHSGLEHIFGFAYLVLNILPSLPSLTCIVMHHL